MEEVTGAGTEVIMGVMEVGAEDIMEVTEADMAVIMVIAADMVDGMEVNGGMDIRVDGTEVAEVITTGTSR